MSIRDPMTNWHPPRRFHPAVRNCFLDVDDYGYPIAVPVQLFEFVAANPSDDMGMDEVVEAMAKVETVKIVERVLDRLKACK